MRAETTHPFPVRSLLDERTPGCALPASIRYGRRGSDCGVVGSDRRLVLALPRWTSHRLRRAGCARCVTIRPLSTDAILIDGPRVTVAGRRGPTKCATDGRGPWAKSTGCWLGSSRWWLRRRSKASRVSAYPAGWCSSWRSGRPGCDLCRCLRSHVGPRTPRLGSEDDRRDQPVNRRCWGRQRLRLGVSKVAAATARGS